MFFHADNGSAFVGLRSRFNGKRQVVYDEANGRRIILDISDKGVSNEIIEDALKEGVVSRNILGGVISALQSRNVAIEMA